MPISGVNSTPHPTAVYASDPALPRRPQDSLPSCLLGFGRTRLSLASSFQLSYRTPHPALGQDFTLSSTARRAQAGSGVRARSARRGARADRSRISVASVKPGSSARKPIVWPRPQEAERFATFSSIARAWVIRAMRWAELPWSLYWVALLHFGIARPAFANWFRTPFFWASR